MCVYPVQFPVFIQKYRFLLECNRSHVCPYLLCTVWSHWKECMVVRSEDRFTKICIFEVCSPSTVGVVPLMLRLKTSSALSCMCADPWPWWQNAKWVWLEPEVHVHRLKVVHWRGDSIIFTFASSLRAIVVSHVLHEMQAYSFQPR